MRIGAGWVTDDEGLVDNDSRRKMRRSGHRREILWVTGRELGMASNPMPRGLPLGAAELLSSRDMDSSSLLFPYTHWTDFMFVQPLGRMGADRLE